MSLNGDSVAVRQLKREWSALDRKVTYHDEKAVEHSRISSMYKDCMRRILKQIEFENMKLRP